MERRCVKALGLVFGVVVASVAFATLAGSGAARGVAKGAVYVAPGGSDQSPCTQAQPCLSFDRGYHVAQSGQVVEIATGAYPAQKISADPSKTGPPNVVFQPAPSASVSAGRVTIFASNVTLQGMRFAWSVQQGADHVTLQNISADGAVYITGAANVSVLGGQVYAPAGVVSDSQIASAHGAVPTGILIDGVSFHDWVDAGPTPGTHHIECLQFGAGINVTVRNSTFQRCEIHDLFIRSWGNTNSSPSPLRNFTIQNNYFGPTLAGYYSLRLAPQTGWPCTNFLIAANTALQNMMSDCNAAGIQFVGNSQPSMSAYGCAHTFGAVWIGNIFASGVPCGSNRVLGSSQSPQGPPPPVTPPGKGDTGPEKPPAADPSPNVVEVRGHISSLSTTALTITGDHSTMTCTRGTNSPSLTGFKLNDKVAATCAPPPRHELIAIAHTD